MEAMGTVSKETMMRYKYHLADYGISDPYPYIHKNTVCLLGDAGHPV